MKTDVPFIEINDLRSGYRKDLILRGISLVVHVNERWAIIGRNGAGKSTLIKCVASLLKPLSGSIIIENENIMKYSSRRRALKIAYVPQKPDGIIPFTVEDYIQLGRYASMGMFAQPSTEDLRVIAEAAELCDVRHLFNRIMNTLSGGELQRVLLAGAVAQQTPILLLDEPTTFLDPAHEGTFFDALSRVHDHRDLTIMMVTHDINRAISNCTHICGLIDGQVAFCGSVVDFRSQCPEVLTDMFGVPFVEYQSNDGRNPVFGTWGETCRV